MQESRSEGKSSLPRLTFSMENCFAAPRKTHCELSWVQSVAALLTFLGRSISNLRRRNSDCFKPESQNVHAISSPEGCN